MTRAKDHRCRNSACDGCLRRAWLLSALSARLDYRGRDYSRLADLLSLGDEELIQAIGGRRRAELQERYARFTATDLAAPEGIETVCRHDQRYPPALRDANAAPSMLNVAGGGVARLAELASTPVVAIVGTARATDYGIETARSLARGLAASGVTVASGLGDGIPAAAHAGALEVDCGTMAVMAGGLDGTCPARWRALFSRVKGRGCALAELPCGCTARRWGHVAVQRIVAALAELTIVVEADESPVELAAARAAQSLQRPVAAVPGRVTSRASTGTHALLMATASLVRGPEDALELLLGSSSPRAASIRPACAAAAHPELPPTLTTTLDSVCAGSDTPDKLIAEGGDAGGVLMALSELELAGMLIRGDGGRYVPRNVSTGRTGHGRGGRATGDEVGSDGRRAIPG